MHPQEVESTLRDLLRVLQPRREACSAFELGPQHAAQDFESANGVATFVGACELPLVRPAKAKGSAHVFPREATDAGAAHASGRCAQCTGREPLNAMAQ